MEKALCKTYSEIIRIAESGRIGASQVCVISVNTALVGKALEEKIATELSFTTALFRSEIDKEKSVLHKTPYAYGFVSREYKNGNICRYTYTAAPVEENTQITVYGTDGELRFDSVTGKIVIYKQIPDYTGDEYVKEREDNAVFDWEKVETRDADIKTARAFLVNEK